MVNNQQYQPIIILFLIETIVFLAIWLMNDYLASLLSIILPVICFALLIISLIAERLEKSNVPKFYFQSMVVTIFAPLCAAILYITIMGGQLDWLTF